MVDGLVSVGCKLPNGIKLELLDNSGVVVAEKTLRGVAHDRMKAPPLLVGGYAFTSIDADFWAAWKEKYKDSPILKEQLVIDHKQEASAKAMAVERSEIRSGKEPINPKTLDKEADMNRRIPGGDSGVTENPKSERSAA